VFSQADPQAANAIAGSWIRTGPSSASSRIRPRSASTRSPGNPCDARSVRVAAADIRGTALTDPIRYPLLAHYLTVAIAIVAVALMPLLPNRSGSGSRPSSSWLGVLLMATRNARRFRAPRRRRQMDVDEWRRGPPLAPRDARSEGARRPPTRPDPRTRPTATRSPTFL